MENIMRRIGQLPLVLAVACNGGLSPGGDFIDDTSVGTEARAMHGTEEILCSGDITDDIEPHLQAGERIVISAGTCSVTATLQVTTSNLTIEGAGPLVTRLLFQPQVAGPLFRFDNEMTTPLENVTLRDLGIKSTSEDGNFAKTAVYIRNNRNFTMENVRIGQVWAADDAETVGIEIHGDELGTFRKLRVQADVPLKIGLNDAGVQEDDLAHHHFKDVNLISNNNPDPVVVIEDGVVMRNVTFDGYQEWRNGGLQWIDGETPARRHSNHLRISNLRVEGMCDLSIQACADPVLDNRPWAIDIQKNPGDPAGAATLDDLWIEFSLTAGRGINVQQGAAWNGIRANGVTRTVLSQVVYEGVYPQQAFESDGQVTEDPQWP
jgi:hypothetical protein